MIDVNVRALTELSLAFVDSLERHRGGLLNVGSMAGFLPGPGMAVYYASKAYVLSFTEALHSELKSRGIRVTVLCPGPVPTEFAARAGVRTAGWRPVFSPSPRRQVAEAGYRGLMQGQRMVVPGLAQQVCHHPDALSCRAACCCDSSIPGKAGAGPRRHIAASHCSCCNRLQSG